MGFHLVCVFVRLYRYQFQMLLFMNRYGISITGKCRKVLPPNVMRVCIVCVGVCLYVWCLAFLMDLSAVGTSPHTNVPLDLPVLALVHNICQYVQYITVKGTCRTCNAGDSACQHYLVQSGPVDV